MDKRFMKKSRLLLLTALLFEPLLVFFAHTDILGAEAPITYDYPVFDIDVKQKDGNVRFEFYHSSGSEQTGRRTPHEDVHIIAIHLRGNSAFWQVMAKPGIKGIQNLTYGTVPPGFVQVVPKIGLAPALEESVDYYVSATGGGRGISVFQYSKNMMRKSK